MDYQMKIKFVQSEGFAGIDLNLELDSNSLPSDEARTLRSMLENSRFFDLPSSSPTPDQGADYLEYEISVESEGKNHTVETTDITMPQDLHPFVAYLRQKALYMKKRA